MNKKINIAIDGYSSCGKSTLAKQLAQHFEYVYIDTGAMYRAVTLYLLENDIIEHLYPIDEKKVTAVLRYIYIQFRFNTNLNKCETYLNDKNVEKDIRTLHIAKNVSKVSAIKSVREKMVKLQQEMAKEKGIVMDGRDIGTVVLPDAELKLFMTASEEVRTERRYQELIARGNNVSRQEVLKNLKQRDYIDTTRKESPLLQAKDALLFDNSELNQEQQFNKVVDMVNEKINLETAI